MAEFSQIIPVSDAKRDLLTLVKKIHQLRESIAITRNGRPAAVLLSFEEYEGLLETIELLSNPRLTALIKKSIQQAQKGKFYSEEEVWA